MSMGWVALLRSSVVPPGMTVEMLVVFGVVAVALFLFVTELLPIDVTAILIMVLLIVLEPWTQISPTEGISGFSNEATITVLAMLIVSSGIERTGIVQLVGRRMAAFAGNDMRKQLGATVGVAGPISGFVNNTPVVAVLVPVVSDLAHEGNTSPSKLLIPLSFASMMGGMLTLIGTSTNILASDVAARLSGEYPELHAFSMFEFTKLGVIVLVVGSVYLLTIGHRLLPERIPPREPFVEEYELDPFLTEVVVHENSPVVGELVGPAIEDTGFEVDVLQMIRDGEVLSEYATRTIEPNDSFILHTDRDTLESLLRFDGLGVVGTEISDPDIESGPSDQRLVEVVIPSRSTLVGETLATTNFSDSYDATVLAFRSRGELVRTRLDHNPMRIGDTLLVQASTDSIDRLSQNRDFIVAHEPERPEYRTGKIPLAIAILLGIVALPALDVQPILVTALAGVVAMVATGVLRPTEVYTSVNWNVIFLLAGVIPLGIALEQSGGAAFLGGMVAESAQFLPPLGVLWLFYIATGLITELVSNNASVVLMIPVGVSAASAIGANPFAFVLAVTFAASTAFLGPIGYQTNLFVYGPGGYRFSDFFRIGAPLQLILSIVTVGGIVVFWGV